MTQPTTSEEIAIEFLQLESNIGICEELILNGECNEDDINNAEKKYNIYKNIKWLPADEVVTKNEVEKVIDDIYDNDTWNGKILKKYLNQKLGLK